MLKNRRLISVSLVLLSFCAALLPVSAFELPLMVACVVLLMLAVLIELVDRVPRPVLPFEGRLVSLSVALLLILMIASIVLSAVPYVALVYSGIFAVFPMMFYLTLRFEGRDFIGPICYGLLVILLFLSLMTLFQYFFVTGYLEDGRINWPMANPNNLAGLMSFGFFGCVSRVFLSKRPFIRGLFVLFSIIVFAAIVATGSRGALYALSGGFVLMAALLWRRVWRNKEAFFALLTGCVLAFFALEYGAAETAQHPMQHFVKAGADLSERFEIWKAAWAIFKDHPWSGTGIGTFFLYYPEYRLADYGTAGLMAHNDLLQFAVEFGFMGPVLIYGLAALLVYYTYRAYRALSADDPQRVQLIAAFCALGACFVHTHITFHLHILSIMIIVGLAMGSWLCLVMRALQAERVERVLPDWVRMGSAAALVLIVTLFAAYVLSNAYFDRAQARLAAGDMVGMAEDLNRADHLAAGKNARAMALAASMQLMHLQQSAEVISPADKRAIVSQVLDLLGKAERINPRLAALQYAYALLERYAGDMWHAPHTEDYYLQESLRLNPQHLLARMRLAQLYRQAGDPARALKVLEAGMNWPYTRLNPLPYYEVTAQSALEQSDFALRDRALKAYVASQAKRKDNMERQKQFREWAARNRFW